MKTLYFILCFMLFSVTYGLAQQAINNSQASEESCAEIEVFDLVEEEATPVNGMPGFYQFLADNFIYPDAVKELPIEAITYVRFVVSKEGNVICAEIIKDREVGYGLDEEAIRVLKMTKWNPAKQRGEVVYQRKILPFRFKPPTSGKKKKRGN